MIIQNLGVNFSWLQADFCAVLPVGGLLTSNFVPVKISVSFRLCPKRAQRRGEGFLFVIVMRFVEALVADKARIDEVVVPLSSGVRALRLLAQRISDKSSEVEIYTLEKVRRGLLGFVSLRCGVLDLVCSGCMYIPRFGCKFNFSFFLIR